MILSAAATPRGVEHYIGADRTVRVAAHAAQALPTEGDCDT